MSIPTKSRPRASVVACQDWQSCFLLDFIEFSSQRVRPFPLERKKEFPAVGRMVRSSVNPRTTDLPGLDDWIVYSSTIIAMDFSRLIIRSLTRDEFDLAVEWAAAEGWNPGLGDADIFWNTDPDGYLGVEYEGEIVGTGSVVSYDGHYGFMGFFIVKPELRGKGIGTRLWFHRRDFLRSRLLEGAAIGMDGVFDMQDWYHRGGFEFTHRNLRMEGVGKATPEVLEEKEVVPLARVSFEEVAAYDTRCFGFEREKFLQSWINSPTADALGYMRDGRLAGFGVIRQCREGSKIGPLFADDSEVATALFDGLGNFAAGSPIWLDVPERNKEAMALAHRNGMQEVFGCARMYNGPAPDIPWDQIFGVTTFELG